MSSPKLLKAVIASGGTKSGSVDLQGRTLVGFYMPATFTGTAMTFEASRDGTTFNVMADGAGADISKTVAVDKYIPLNPQDFAGVSHIKLVSGSTESQEDILWLATKRID